MLKISLSVIELGNPSKILSLGRLITLHNPDILLLHETLVVGDSIISYLKTYLSRWNFICMKDVGISSGFISRWKTISLSCSTCWDISSIPGDVPYSRDLGTSFTLLNIYGPHTHRVDFVDN